MITKKILKLIAVYVFSILFSATAAAATCEPALILLRHAEDTANDPHELVASGRAHATAYRDDLPALLDGIGICRPGKFFSSDIGSLNPYNTVKPSADIVAPYIGNPKVGKEDNVLATDQNGIDLTPDYIWGNKNFLSYLMPSVGQSTLMAVSKQSLWDGEVEKIISGKKVKKSYRGIFNLLLTDKTIIKKLSATKPAPFNLVYIFKAKDLAYGSDTGTFSTISTYVQLYDPKPACRFRVNSKLGSFKIVGLEPYIVDGNQVMVDSQG